MKILEVDTATGNMDKRGNLYQLINAFISAYNHRTDVMERAVKLDERIKAVTHKLDTAGDELKDSVDKNG